MTIYYDYTGTYNAALHTYLKVLVLKTDHALSIHYYADLTDLFNDLDSRRERDHYIYRSGLCDKYRAMFADAQTMRSLSINGITGEIHVIRG